MDISMFVKNRGLAQKLTPTAILEAFQRYVEYINTDGVWHVNEVVRAKTGAYLIAVPHRVPLTVKGFCVFAGISYHTFLNYMTPESATYPMYHEVAEYIRDICEVNAFNGAAIGVFNGNLMAGLIKRSFGAEAEDAAEKDRVREIMHEVVFTDFEDVTDTQAELPQHVQSYPVPPPPITPTYEYDAVPNKHSGQFNQAEHNLRNNITEED